MAVAVVQPVYHVYCCDTPCVPGMLLTCTILVTLLVWYIWVCDLIHLVYHTWCMNTHGVPAMCWDVPRVPPVLLGHTQNQCYDTPSVPLYYGTLDVPVMLCRYTTAMLLIHMVLGTLLLQYTLLLWYTLCTSAPAAFQIITVCLIAFWRESCGLEIIGFWDYL